jgi:4-hydroxy-3-methylbut-2-enyl diphosphate reductase IspH
VGSKTETATASWLPSTGAVSVGLTSGASTPDNLVGAAIAKLTEFCS